MRIAIIGIGGIGGYIGSKLCKNFSHSHEHTICFIQRGPHGELIALNGLTYKGETTEIFKPQAMFSSFENAGVFDILFLCTKSKDLESTVLSFQNNIHASSCIITLLNGVSNTERIQQILPHHRILQGCIYVSAAIESPGVVTQVGGSGKVIFGPENGIIKEIDKEIHAILFKADIPSELSDTIQTEVWKKYLFICTFATVTSRYNLPIGVLIRNPEYYKITCEILNEICEVAKKHEIHFSKDDTQAVLDLAFKIPEHTPTSMQIDVYKGKEPEIEIFTGYIIQEAQKYSISVPVHTKLYAELIKIIKKEMHEK